VILPGFLGVPAVRGITEGLADAGASFTKMIARHGVVQAAQVAGLRYVGRLRWSGSGLM